VCVSAFRPFEKEEKKKLKNWKRIWFAIKSNKHQRKKKRILIIIYKNDQEVVVVDPKTKIKIEILGGWEVNEMDYGSID